MCTTHPKTKHAPPASGDIEKQRKELAHIRRRYGTTAMTVPFEMYVTDDEMAELYGEQCEEYEPGCCVCKNWMLYCRTGRAEFTLPRKDLLKILLGEGKR